MSVKIVSTQLALFYRDHIERPDLEFGDLNINMMNIFDAIPNVMNIPSELPADLPIVNLRSTSNKYHCFISRSRIDFHRNKVDENESQEEILNDFNAKVLKLIEYALSKRDFIRFGLVCRYFYQDTDNIRTIKNKYFNDKFGQVSELSLRFNQKTKFKNWPINDMIDIGDAVENWNGIDTKGIFIQRDINNDVVDGLTLTKDDLLEISKSKANLLAQKPIEDLIK